MNQAQNHLSDQFYRKRPQPFRVVSLSTLNKTTERPVIPNSGIMVNSSGNASSEGSWLPMSKPSIPINVSSNGWSGLHARVMATRILPAEVA